MHPLFVIGYGMVSGVGDSAPASCAAIHCSIDNFDETRFIARGEDWIVGSQVQLDPPVRGREKLLSMLAAAVLECVQNQCPLSTPLPVLLCVSEESRPGRFENLNETLLDDLAVRLNMQLSSASMVIPNGPVGGVEAVERAIDLIHVQKLPLVVVAGTDTLLVAETLDALDKSGRLLTPSNSNGLVPGEAASAVLLSASDARSVSKFVLRGVGYGLEDVTIMSEEPFRAEGMSTAIRNAFKSAECTYDDVDYRITDVSGEQYPFKEAALSAVRTMKKVKEEYDIWHPADSIGDIGAAFVPTMISVAVNAAKTGFAAGDGVLFHCANDDGQRGVIIGSSVEAQ